VFWAIFLRAFGFQILNKMVVMSSVQPPDLTQKCIQFVCFS
jgi:hypothetical protein